MPRRKRKQPKSDQPSSTKERLAGALYDLLKPGDHELNELVERASAGLYDDFESPLATPQVSNATYMTRRLFHLFVFLAAEPAIDYSRGDLFMAHHNCHIWGLTDVLQGLDEATRKAALISARDTFARRIEVEIAKVGKEPNR